MKTVTIQNDANNNSGNKSDNNEYLYSICRISLLIIYLCKPVTRCEGASFLHMFVF